MRSATVPSPPGPRGEALRRTRGAFMTDPAGFLLELHREYGDIVRFRLGLRDAYLLAHPDHIKDVLVTNHERFHKGPAMNDGRRLVGENLFTIEVDVHRRHRRLMQPAFRWDRIKAYDAIMVDEATRISAALRAGETVEMNGLMAQLTLGVAVRALFGADLPEETRLRVTRYVRELLAPWFNRTGVRQVTFESEDYRETLAAAATVVDDMVRDRRATAARGEDLLSLLLAAQDDDGSVFTDKEARDEIAALIVAGHETTSTALTWTWYLLSQHPDVERRLHAEVDRVLEGDTAAFAAIQRLPYLDRVLAETLRVRPTVWGFDRTVVQPHVVGEYELPAGSLVFLSPYVVHRDPRWFPDPERFDPDRWTPKRRATIPRYAYFPFGGGLRMCIGQPFAMVEAALVTAVIARRWRFETPPGHIVELDGSVTLRPKGGLPMIAKPRG